MDDTISRQAAIELFKDDIAAVNELNNLPFLPDRMKYVQESVNIIMNTCKSDSIKDKAFRNAARMIQNAIDGEAPDFETIEELPSAQPGWIPVTERLPDKEGSYLCTVQGIMGKTTYLRIADFHPDIYVEYDIEEHKPGFIDYDSEYGYYEVTKVVAWQPLPTPYREGGQDNGAD